MKSRLIVLGLFSLLTGLAHATPLPAPAEQTPMSQSTFFDAPAPDPEITGWADRCTSATTNGWAFKAPNRFILWLDVFSAPDIWLEFARRGQDPHYYLRTLESLLDPATAQNYLEWTDPRLYERWLGALAQPEFLEAVTGILTQPERIARWAALPLDPRPWHLMLNAMSPETWAKWLALPFDPRIPALVNKALAPETAEAWERVLSDPSTYPALQALQASPS